MRPQDLPPPPFMRHLPRDERGFVVPWFVPKVEGEWDFQHIVHGRVAQAVRDERCWCCGGNLFRNKAFVVGPMCVVNRISSEPPSHVECAEYAVKVCPFLTRPRMRRLPRSEGDLDAPGIMLDRNPGVSALWVVRNFKPFKPPNGGMLFRILEPTIRIECWAEGRKATTAEIENSVETGLPALRKLATEDDAHNGDTGASRELERMIAAGRALLGLPPVELELKERHYGRS